MNTFKELLNQYYEARKRLDDYMAPFLHLMKKGRAIADSDSQKLEELGEVVSDLENRLYAYRGNEKC